MSNYSQNVFEFEGSSPLLTVDEIYKNPSQSLLQSLKEDRRIERKPPGVHADFLGTYFSMWANTHPDGGLIIIGIEDNGTISGCAKVGVEHINDLEWSAGAIFCPDASYDTKRVPVKLADGKDDFVLLIRVFYKRKGRLARTNKGKAYFRVSDKRKELTPEEIHELEIDRGEIDLEQEPSTLPYPDDFDTDLIKQYVGGYKANRGLDDSLSVEQILKLNHLGVITKTIGFIPNKAVVGHLQCSTLGMV